MDTLTFDITQGRYLGGLTHALEQPQDVKTIHIENGSVADAIEFAIEHYRSLITQDNALKLTKRNSALSVIIMPKEIIYVSPDGRGDPHCYDYLLDVYGM